jgi:prepilin-type N-terminal cleavage/methylation domain-containing protein
MDKKGFSLIELLVVMGIMMILLLIAVPQFGAMSRKAAIEKQTRQIYADLTTARVRAMNTNRTHRVNLGTTTTKAYTVADDKNSDGLFTADEIIVTSVALPYSVTWSGTETVIDFGSRGTPTATGKITTNVSSDAVVDCINVYLTRMTIGKLSGVTCEPK